MAYFDISAFFGNTKTNHMNSFNFSDYSAIKNGSYGKLLKSYYASVKKDSTVSKNDKETNKNQLLNTDSTGLSKMKKEADGLKTKAAALNEDELWEKKNGEYDMDKITSAVKSFANEYNDVINQAQKVGSKDVTMQTGFMKSMTSTMANALSKVGVSVGTDGKMTVDENSFKNADVKDIKALFAGKYSYTAQIEEKASAISSAAVRSSSMYSSNGLLTSTLQGSYNDWI